ncbi:MAG: cyclic peptide export ABC transporter [Pyrinomonadaceae bacterium]
MKLFYFLLRASKKVVILAVLVGIISGAANSGLVILIHRALSGGERAPQLVWAFAGVCLVVLLTRVTSELLLIHLGQGAILNLRLDMSRRILATPLSQLEKIGPHKLLATLTDDVIVITNTLVYVPVLCINLAILCGCLIYLGSFSWEVLFGVLGFMIVGVACYQVPVLKARRYLKLARDQRDMLYKHFRAMTDGIKELKLHRERRGAFLSDELQTTAESYRLHNFRGMFIYTVANCGGQLLLFLVIGLILFALPALKEMDTNTLTGYSLTILYIMSPLNVILSAVPVVGRASVALKKIEELGFSLAEQYDGRNSPDRPRLKPAWGRLEMAGVTHVYYREREDNNFTLGPIDISFRPGEIVFLIGGNGSGKTTLVKLLTGLYVPETGELRLDDEPVNDENIEQYRQLFSTVFSDFHLFEKMLGLESSVLDEDARRYLIQLHLDHKVKVEGGTLSTIALSQGQRKRLALLTAYLEDRPFYIFDEWAADQDPVFKELFYTNLLAELKARGKTVLVISHDDKYYYVADRVLKLNYGKLEYDSLDAYPRPDPYAIPVPLAS